MIQSKQASIVCWCCWLLALVLIYGCEVGATNEVVAQDTSLIRMDGQALIVTQDLVFKAQYMPVEWQAKQAGETTLENYLGHYYFQMKIQPRTTEHKLKDLLANQAETEIPEQWNDFLFRQKDKFVLEVANEKFPCVLYHVTPAGISGLGATLNLVFKNKQLNHLAEFEGPIRLMYQDDLWTQSLLTFDFTADELNQMSLPELDK